MGTYKNHLHLLTSLHPDLRESNPNSSSASNRRRRHVPNAPPGVIFFVGRLGIEDWPDTGHLQVLQIFRKYMCDES